MKKLTFEGFEAMTSKAKTELIKKHLGLNVCDGWKICGHDDDSIIVGRNDTHLLGGWYYPYTGDVILSKHKYYLYATPAAIAAINKKTARQRPIDALSYE